MNQTDREEITELKVEVSHIKDDVNEIKKNQEETGKKFDKLLFHLIGDVETKTKGIIEGYHGIETRLSRLEKIYLTAGLFLGVIMMFRDKLIDFFINH